MKTPIARLARKTTIAAALLAAAPLATGPALAQDTAAAPADEQAPQTATVERGAFTATVRAQGRYAADPVGSLAFEPDAYTGKLTVAEVFITHGPVSPGAAVLRLDAPDLADQLEAAQRAAHQAERRLAWALQEQEMTQAEQRQASETRDRVMADTLEDQARWDAFEKDDTYTQSRLGMENAEARLADEEEELAQLEQLYEGARLASRTQDIVLERARRRLSVSRQMMEITRRSHEVMMGVTLPRRERDLRLQLERLRLQHTHAALRAEIARERSAMELDAAQRANDEAQDHLAQIEADAERLTLVAEEGGVLTSAITLKPGDAVSARQPVATLQHRGQGTIALSVNAEDLRTLREGDTVAIRWRPFAEITTTGTVRTIAWQGQGTGESTTYAVVVEVNEVADRIRPGMLADLTATRTLDNALSVPKDAVARDEDGAFVMLREGDTFTRRGVVTGATHADRVQIIQGLEAGDTVRVPAQ